MKLSIHLYDFYLLPLSMFKRSYPAVLLWLLTVVAAYAGEPPSTPLLRLDNGMHTAMINRIDIDAGERFVLSASDDKTARLWGLNDGRLLRTFRIPQAAGDEGKLYAGALSPDGNTVALAGWAGKWEEHDTIYLLDRVDGRLRQRLTGMPNVIHDLAFSADGRYLAAASGGKNGIRVFDTASGRVVFADRDYDGASYSVDFAADGRLLATCEDSQLRLYGADFHLLAKRAAPGGNDPFFARFAPDGRKLAVGFSDSTVVEVLSAEDLSLLYRADTSAADNGNLSSVAWSRDGETLYAGGMYDNNSDNPIAAWSEQGRGQIRWLPAAQNTVMDLKPLRDGGLLVATSDPTLGRLDHSGQTRWQQRGAVADFRGIFNRSLLLSNDGLRLHFGYAYDGKQPALFDLAQRRLSVNPTIDSTLRAPDTTSLPLSGWGNTYDVQFNGHKLALDQYERSRSAALAPDRQHLLLGTNWSLRWFGSDGQQVWQQDVPGAVWGVNVAGNGKIGVTALGDGTLRWYRLSDGQELLAFYPHPDKQRWVLWTPDGYYDASPGAEDLIGWHLNRGKDQAADFFVIGRFRDTYYRPDVVGKVLETLDGGEALRLANLEANKRQIALDLRQQLPPVITVLSPQDGGTFAGEQVTVQFKLRSPSGEPVTAVKALIDGRPVSQQRGLNRLGQGEGQTDSLTLTLPPRDVELTLIAENRYAASEPSTVRLHWAGQSPADEFVIKPKLYVLSVGTSAYDNPALKLGFAAKDAADFAREIARQKNSGLYRDVEVQQVIDGDKDAILDGLDWLQREVTAKDVAMLFMAGHGVNDRSGNYYYLPKEADTERLKRTGLPYHAVKDTISNLPGKVLYFLDTCHSGNVMGSRRGANDINGVINELTSAENGIVVFAASSGSQYSLEDAAWGNGAFTKALLEGLDGKADFRGSGRITVNMLDLYLSERVKALTHGQQTPTTTKPATVPDFPVVVR